MIKALSNLKAYYLYHRWNFEAARNWEYSRYQKLVETALHLLAKDLERFKASNRLNKYISRDEKASSHLRHVLSEIYWIKK